GPRFAVLTTRDLFKPKWLLAHVIVVAIAVTFVMLGFWQLDRHRERIETNQLISARLDQPAVPLDVLMAAANGDWSTIEYRRATVTGVFVVDDEVLIRSQVQLGASGFHLVTPLDIGGGE